MTLHPDDPRLTAYLLEELPPEERAAVEATIQQSPELYEEAMALHDTARQLADALRQQPLLALDQTRTCQVEAAIAAHTAKTAADPGPVPPEPEPALVPPQRECLRMWLRRWWPALAAVSAVTVLAVAWKPFQQHQPAKLARSPAPAAENPQATTPPSLPPAATVTPVELAPSDPFPEPAPNNLTGSGSPTAREGGRMDLAMMMRYGLMSPDAYRRLEESVQGNQPPPSVVAPHPGPGAPAWYGRAPAQWAPGENSFQAAREVPRSTFSLDVDTASYSILRRHLRQGVLPPPGFLRLEELINYFPYDYAPPTDGRPLAVHLEIAECPWQSAHRLLRVGIKAKTFGDERRPAANLVFLVDVSGSMRPENKLPLLQRALRLLVGELRAEDRVAIVTYADSARVVLPPTSGAEKAVIFAALDRLVAAGSTNGGAGLETAYGLANAHFDRAGVNRVILCSDGDFNVGMTYGPELNRFIAERARSGVYLTTLGFGMDNYRDDRMEQLAHHGNGNYGYVDTIEEARKLLVEQLEATVVTVARDVKVQIEFNPFTVQSYRLLGYENRRLAARDFNDDLRDAGDVGAGHTVTVLYEILPFGLEPGVDPLRYSPTNAEGRAGELLTFKLRYKEANSETSHRLGWSVRDGGRSYAQASTEFKFAAAVAAYGLIVNQSAHRGNATLSAVAELAGEALGADPWGYRREFLDLVAKTRALRPNWP